MREAAARRGVCGSRLDIPDKLTMLKSGRTHICDYEVFLLFCRARFSEASKPQSALITAGRNRGSRLTSESRIAPKLYLEHKLKA